MPMGLTVREELALINLTQCALIPITVFLFMWFNLYVILTSITLLTQ